MYKKINIILIVIFWLLIGCEKEENETISTGCIPNSETFETKIWGPPWPSSEYRYIYDNNKILRTEFVPSDESTPNTNYNFEYTDGILTKFISSNGSYHEYYYNASKQLIRLNTFQPINESEDGRLTHIINFKYEEDKIVEIEDESKLSGKKEIKYISYYPNTGNIDSVKIYNNKSELIELEIFAYDNFNNPLKNLILPINYSNYTVQGLTVENNFKMKKIIRYNTSSIRQFNYENQYNEYGYPEDIKILETFCLNCTSLPDTSRIFEMSINIDYINCE